MERGRHFGKECVGVQCKLLPYPQLPQGLYHEDRVSVQEREKRGEFRVVQQRWKIEETAENRLDDGVP